MDSLVNRTYEILMSDYIPKEYDIPHNAAAFTIERILNSDIFIRVDVFIDSGNVYDYLIIKRIDPQCRDLYVTLDNLLEKTYSNEILLLRESGGLVLYWQYHNDEFHQQARYHPDRDMFMPHTTTDIITPSRIFLINRNMVNQYNQQPRPKSIEGDITNFKIQRR